MTKRRIGIVAILLILVILVLPVFAQRTAPTDVLQTIPPIVVSSASSVAGCTLMSLSPGSAVAGTSGVISAYCPGAQSNGAIRFSGATETPTFILATGFYQLSIQTAVSVYGSGCTFQFRQFDPLSNGFITIGQNITNSGPVHFVGQNTLNSTFIQLGIYDYCLWYSNPPVNGILSFTVAWSP